MKSHKEIEIDTAIFSSTYGFAPGEITGFFFFIKALREMKKGNLACLNYQRTSALVVFLQRLRR